MAGEEKCSERSVGAGWRWERGGRRFPENISKEGGKTSEPKKSRGDTENLPNDRVRLPTKARWRGRRYRLEERVVRKKIAVSKQRGW